MGKSPTGPPRFTVLRKNATKPYSSLPGEAVFANSTGLLVVIFGLLVLYILQASSWKRPAVGVTAEGQVRGPGLPCQDRGGPGLEKGHQRRLRPSQEETNPAARRETRQLEGGVGSAGGKLWCRAARPSHRSSAAAQAAGLPGTCPLGEDGGHSPPQIRVVS